jgi:hypothetical protein
LGNDFDFKTDVSETFDTSAEALSSQQAIGVLIKAFQDVDERQRRSTRQAFENSIVWKQFEYQNVGNGRRQRIIDLMGGVSDGRFWRHAILAFYRHAVHESLILLS